MHDYQRTGMRDTGHDPPRDEWRCGKCGDEAWVQAGLDPWNVLEASAMTCPAAPADEEPGVESGFAAMRGTSAESIAESVEEEIENTLDYMSTLKRLLAALRGVE